MPNMTMTIDERVLKKARKLAVEKNTTLSAMVRTYLQNLTTRVDEEKETVISELKRAFDIRGVVVGQRYWRRENLHER